MKVNIIIEDGYAYLKASHKKYNCIIIDSTDPINQAKILVTKKFLRECYKSLTKMGVIIQQSGSPLFFMGDVTAYPAHQITDDSGGRATVS